MKSLSKSMLVYAVLGDPVAHSLSPAMQNSALRAMGLEACYHAFRVPADLLEEAIRGAAAMGFGGLNLTIPLKEKALAIVEPDEDAVSIGAVNTVYFHEGIRGANTDGKGAAIALSNAGVRIRGSKALLIGAGGAARAIAYQLVKDGAELAIANRSPARADALADALGASGHGFDEIRNLVEWADLIINATSVGMKAGDPRIFDGSLLQERHSVFDIVYNRETELMADAKRAGARLVPGIMMLVHQGALSLKIWTGLDAPVSVMERAVREELKRRQEG